MKFKTIILSIALFAIITTGCNGKEYIDNTNSKKYYGSEAIEYTWVYDVSNYKNVIENSDSILKVKIVGIENGTFQYASGNNDNPLTPIKVEVLEVLYGDEVSMNVHTIYKNGGDVTIKQMIDYYPASKISKMELDKLSEEQKNQYISFKSNANFDLEENGVYIVCLKPGTFKEPLLIVPEGYGVFKFVSEDTYKNLITNTNVNISEFRK